MLLKVSSWNWNPSTLTLLLTLLADIVISFSAVIVMLASPPPALVERILRFLAAALFCVSWNVKLPSPVLSSVCATEPSNVISGSLKYDLTLTSISPALPSPVLLAPNSKLPEVSFILI